MTLAVGETSQTRINAEIRRLSRALTAEQVYRLDAALAGADGTNVQNVFGVGCAVVAGTVYTFEVVGCLTKTAGTNSHNISLGYGGTATISKVSVITIMHTAAATASSISNASIRRLGSAASGVMATGITVADNQFRWIARGSFSCSASGTFIPQYTLSAAPGGAYSTDTGSFARVVAVGSVGNNTSVGSWS